MVGHHPVDVAGQQVLPQLLDVVAATKQGLTLPPTPSAVVKSVSRWPIVTSRRKFTWGKVRAMSIAASSALA
jgi:hypothetical protein